MFCKIEVMSDIAKTIESRFASSVKSRVRFWCESRRPRGSPRAALYASLDVGESRVFHTHGTAACTGVLQTRGNDGGGDEQYQQHLIEDRLIYEALTKYAELSIDAILASNNHIIRAMGFLDARLGKTRLAKMNVKHEHAVVRRVFAIRCECEGLPVVQSEHAITARKQPRYTQVTNEPDEEAKTRATLTRRKRSKNIGAFLADLEHGRALDPSVSPVARMLLDRLKSKRLRGWYISALKTLADSSKVINETHLNGVLELIRDRHAGLRPLETWKARSHNVDRQFSSLARHLFANYEVPLFMDKAWHSGNRLHQKWFKHIGAGYNIRKAENLPVELTKMMAHYFLTAPDHYSIESAFRWGQARALGADRQMADAIVQTRLSETFVDNEFWLSVIGFFARNPMLDTVHIGPIVDYIWNQKYEDVIEFVERGVAVNQGPAQPNFSMKGRNVNTLLAQVERWHTGLNKRKAGWNLQWPKSAVRDFEFVEGSAENRNMRIWKIRELLSSAELNDEGRQMRHCVATYAQSCHRGACGIWSMSVKTKDGVEKVLTIEVQLSQKAIRQVRGKMNRLPQAKEREIIQRWAAQAGLSYV